MKLKEARTTARPKVAQKALASALGVTRTSISNIENVRHRVFLDQVYAASAMLDVPLSSLLPERAEILGMSAISSSGLEMQHPDHLMPFVAKAMQKASRRASRSTGGLSKK